MHLGGRGHVAMIYVGCGVNKTNSTSLHWEFQLFTDIAGTKVETFNK